MLNYSIKDLLFLHYSILQYFWFFPSLTENGIDCKIRRVQITKTQMKLFKCPLFDRINEMTSDKR